MTTKQGDLSLLNDPVAQQLLKGPYPAHLAYTWSDGSPRVIPIGMTWTGTELVTATPHNAPKLKALKDGDKVAVTFDSYTYPFKVLYIRGTVRISPYEGVVPEWAQAADRIMGKDASEAFGQVVGGLIQAKVVRFVRFAVQPTWVGILDFEQRFPSGIEKGMEMMPHP